MTKIRPFYIDPNTHTATPWYQEYFRLTINLYAVHPECAMWPIPTGALYKYMLQLLKEGKI